MPLKVIQGHGFKLRTTKFSMKKLETLLYRMLFINLQTIISFCRNTVATGEYRVNIAVLEGEEGDISHQPFLHR